MKLDINFAFEGFRLIARRPWALPAWGLVYIVGIILAFIVAVPFAWPVFQTLGAGAVADPSVFASHFLALFAAYALFILVFWFTIIIITCAIYRGVLSDGPMGFGFVRIGRAELRVFLVSLLLGVIAIVASLVIGLIGALLGALLGGILGAINSDLSAIGMIIGVVLIYGVFIWLSVRMSLYAVQNMEGTSFNLFGSWALTGGKAWLLFFGYFISALLGMFIYVVFSFGGLAIMGGGLQNMAVTGATPTGVGLVVTLLYSLFTALIVFPAMMAIMVAPAAAAYRALTGGKTKQVENIF